MFLSSSIFMETLKKHFIIGTTIYYTLKKIKQHVETHQISMGLDVTHVLVCMPDTVQACC